jgi:hypothetical protein
LIKYRNDSAGRSLEDLLTTTAARRFLGEDAARIGFLARRFTQPHGAPLTRKLHLSVEKLSAADVRRGGVARANSRAASPEKDPPG